MSKELEDRLRQLETKIEMIEERNKRVEWDKTWETSLSRKILVAIFTYLAIVMLMVYLNIAGFWINAIIPTIAFLISTSSLPLFKEMWKKFRSN